MTSQTEHPRIDPTTRISCKVHGAYAPATYIGRERYGCWHCTVDAIDNPKPEEASPLAQYPEMVRETYAAGLFNGLNPVHTDPVMSFDELCRHLYTHGMDDAPTAVKATTDLGSYDTPNGGRWIWVRNQ